MRFTRPTSVFAWARYMPVDAMPHSILQLKFTWCRREITGDEDDQESGEGDTSRLHSLRQLNLRFFLWVENVFVGGRIGISVSHAIIWNFKRNNDISEGLEGEERKGVIWENSI